MAHRKLTKESGGIPVIELVENEDIVAGLVRARREGQVIVGFAAETPETAGDEEELLARARRKRQRKGVDLLVVNEVGWERGFEAGENEVMVLGSDGLVTATASGSKRVVAAVVLDALRPLWTAGRTSV